MLHGSTTAVKGTCADFNVRTLVPRLYVFRLIRGFTFRRPQDCTNALSFQTGLNVSFVDAACGTCAVSPEHAWDSESPASPIYDPSWPGRNFRSGPAKSHSLIEVIAQ